MHLSALELMPQTQIFSKALGVFPYISQLSRQKPSSRLPLQPVSAIIIVSVFDSDDELELESTVKVTCRDDLSCLNPLSELRVSLFEFPLARSLP